MQSLGDTIGRLAQRRAAMVAAATAIPGRDRLSDLTDFGSNPGALRARRFVPDDLPAGAPLIVVLHGCTQTAAAYDLGAGWSGLAEANGFALLYPEQNRANNSNLCFNWFVPEDVARGSGEVESIRRMIAAMLAAHRLDPARVFITGLSAGGAMALSMLATYPELFAGGAIIAGVPHGVAATVPEAFDRMRGQGLPKPAQLAALVRKAAPAPPRWPKLSVWQGSADATVDPANAEAIIGAWRALHELPAKPSHADSVNGHPRRVWRDAGGADIIEAITVTGMAHGTPIAASGPDACGQSAPHMLDVGLSSTRRIAAFWGLAPLLAAGEARAATAAPGWPGGGGVETMIGNALRQAGLLR